MVPVGVLWRFWRLFPVLDQRRNPRREVVQFGQGQLGGGNAKPVNARGHAPALLSYVTFLAYAYHIRLHRQELPNC